MLPLLREAPAGRIVNVSSTLGSCSVEQAAREPVRLALLDDRGPTGTFSNDAGPIPW